MATAPDLQRVIEALLVHETSTILIEADAITFMDAAGLSPLIEASIGTAVVVHNPSRPVRRLLQLTSLDGWISGAEGTARELL